MHKSDGINIDIRVFLRDIWRGFLKFRWRLAGIFFLFGAVPFIHGMLLDTPQYTCSAVYAVHTERSAAALDSGFSVYTFFYHDGLANQLSNVFSYAVASEITHERICADLGLTELSAELSAEFVPRSNMLTLTVTGDDPQITYDVMQSLVRNYTAVTDAIIGRTQLAEIEAPRLPTVPSNRGAWILAVFRGLVIGAIADLLLVVLYALFRDTVRDKEQLCSSFDVHCLGVLPHVPRRVCRKSLYASVPHLADRGNAFWESMRVVSSAVFRASADCGKVLMLTGTAPGEGTSFVALHLASAMASQHPAEPVLLIDCDLHSADPVPELDRQWVPIRSVAQGTVYRSEQLRLDLLRFDHRLRGEPSILTQAELSALIDDLRVRYHRILIDTPACGAFAQAELAARVSDGLIYVIRHDTVMQDRIFMHLWRMQSAGGTFLGCILNDDDGDSVVRSRFGTA